MPSDGGGAAPTDFPGVGIEADVTARRQRATPVAVLAAVVAIVAGCSDSGPASASGSSSSSVPVAPEVITSLVPAAFPPFIARTTWVQTPLGRSLQVVPTASGRRAHGNGDEDEAWREVVAEDPTAQTPGMRMQFGCHWIFARILEPNKPSWNLEPWRPVVTERQMVGARCNPGAPEE